jgi:hypothetical protein
MTEVPLIWTSKGNLPVADLKRDVEWTFSPTGIVLKEIYTLGEEVVRSSADVYKLPDGMVFNTQGHLNG